MSERNPGGDRGRRSPSTWPHEPDPDQPEDDGAPGSSIFGPVTNDRYPQPRWPGETDGPGSSVFDASTAPDTPRLSPPRGQVQLPPPTRAPQRPQPAYPPTVPQHPQYPQYPGQPDHPGYPQYPEQPYPDPTRPQPRLPDGGRPQPRQRSWDERPGHERRTDDRDRGRGRGGRDRGPGGGFPLGMGFLLGATGLACFLLSLLVLPWFEVAGQEVTLADMREAFTVPATDPDSLPGAADPEAGGDPTATTLPGTPALPSPDDIQDTVENEVRDAATEAAASAIDSGKARYLEIYTETLWLVLAVAVSLAVLFSTILSPKSFALSLLLGFRRLSGFVTVVAGIVHGVALWIVFTGNGAPDPAFGIWLGVGGLIAVLLGCVVGPKR